MAYSKIILNGETLMDVTSDTVDAGNLLSGKTATKNSGAKVTGNIASKSSSDLTVSGATVTAPAGYYSTAASKAVTTTTHPNPTAAIASSTGIVTATHTQGTGYVTGGTTTGTLNLTTQAAQTINTSTVDQTIASNRWLTGTQTIKSVTTSNLTAANIASGVTVKVGDANNASRISQVTGTYAPAVSSLTVTPTETAQTFNATGVYGYKPVTVNAISSTYVGTGVAKKSSADTTFASTMGTFTAPVGYYSTAATKTITTQAAQTIYPSTATQYVNSYRWLTGSQTIASVTTTNLTASNIAEGVVVKVGDTSNASRITQVTGTHKGGGGHDAILLNDGTYNTTLPMYKYVSYNNTRYYTNEDTFNFNEGDTIETMIYGIGGGSNVYLNNTLIGSGMTVSFSAPSYPLAVYFSNGDGIHFNKAYPSGTLSITSNGTYSVYGYSSASVNVSGGEYYSAYKIIVERDTLFYNSSFADFIDYIGQISTISSYLFAGKQFMTGTWTFSNCQRISANAFTCDGRAGWTVANVSFNFPIASLIGPSAFLNQQQFQSINCPSCTTINASAFYSCSKLTTISFPVCTSIGQYAFVSCSALTTASFPSCTYIGNYAFSSCTQLSTISFPICISIDGRAFAGCSKLTTINFPSCALIGAYAFINCISLTTASFPVCSYIIQYAFSGCQKLSIISFPSCKSIGWSAFANCSTLTTVSFPTCTSIDGYVFNSCSALTTANFPSCTSIGTYAFTNCTSLTTVSFPACTYIGNYAFNNCSALTAVSFPACTYISNYAFSRCVNLISLYLNQVSSVPTAGTNIFSSTPISNYSTVAGRYGSIFVPSSLYTAFTTATNWSAYSARMVSV